MGILSKHRCTARHGVKYNNNSDAVSKTAATKFHVKITMWKI